MRLGSDKFEKFGLGNTKNNSSEPGAEVTRQQLSYAELAGPKRVTWFVSHFWGTSFRHFVKSLTKHAESLEGEVNRAFSMASSAINYWICSLSNNQWQIQQELGDGDLDPSDFLGFLGPLWAAEVMSLVPPFTWP